MNLIDCLHLNYKNRLIAAIFNGNKALPISETFLSNQNQDQVQLTHVFYISCTQRQIIPVTFTMYHQPKPHLLFVFVKVNLETNEK
jgi:hypothetical protein